MGSYYYYLINFVKINYEGLNLIFIEITNAKIGTKIKIKKTSRYKNKNNILIK